MSINNLAESIASIFLLEDENSIQKIVVYSGRFQPFHMGHFQTYEMLCKQFGKQNVYIATSNKTDSIKSPFDFNDKIRTITSLFAVPSDKIVNVKNPYNPTEILSKFDSNKIAYIAAVSEKDGDRLNHGKYFKPYKPGEQLLPMKQEGYFYVYPMAPFKVEGKPINATTIRSMFGNAAKSNEDKMAFFKQIYPKYDGRIFDLLVKKISSLHEGVSLNEGGHAVTARPIKKEELSPIMDYIKAKIFKALNLEGLGKDVEIIGSYNKKGPDQTYGDIDLVVLASKFEGQDVKSILNNIDEKLKPLNLETKVQMGFNQVSVSVPIPNTHEFAQVDLMLSDNLEWSKFAYHSPDFTKNESKYKGFYRNNLLLAIFSEAFKKVNKQSETGEEIEYFQNVMRMDKGILSLTKSKLGKSGQAVKSPTIIPNSLKFITNVPQDAMNLIFKDIHPNNVDTFEKTYALLKSNRFKFPEKVDQIISKFKHYLELMKVPLPSELSENIKRAALQEGGAAGHLQHVFEDQNLTFEQLKDIITKSLAGKLDAVQEKMDGQNLMVSWKDGKLVAARTQSETRNSGEKAMDTDAVALKFSGRGAIQQAFTEAMNDLSKAISSIDENLRQELFQNGKCFLNLEILYPDTENVIPYGATQILMHHFREFDETGKQIKQDNEGVSKLESALERIQQTTQKTFKIKKTSPVEIEQIGKGTDATNLLIGALNKLMSKWHVTDGTKLSVLNGKKWANKIKRACENTNMEVSNDLVKLLLKRWLYKDKSVSVKTIIGNVQNDSFKQWIVDTDKQSDEINKKHMQFIEILTFKLGVEVLKKAKAFATLNADEAVQKMKDQLQKSIDAIQNSNDEKGKQIVKAQLERLNAIGGFDAIVPSEGIVFTYNNKLYKLTGAFSSIHRILGYLMYK